MATDQDNKDPYIIDMILNVAAYSANQLLDGFFDLNFGSIIIGALVGLACVVALAFYAVALLWVIDLSKACIPSGQSQGGEQQSLTAQETALSRSLMMPG